jgi:hypothetical protein
MFANVRGFQLAGMNYMASQTGTANGATVRQTEGEGA